MKLAVSSSEQPLTSITTDLLTLGVFDDYREDRRVTDLDAALGGVLLRAADEEQFKAKKLSSFALHSHGKLPAARILLVGLGARKDFSAPDLRLVGARAARTAATTSARSVTVAPPTGTDASPDALARFSAEGILLGRYRFDKYLSEDRRQRDKLESASIVAPGASNAALTRAEHTAAAIARTRDLVNEPAAAATPTRLAEFAGEMAREHGLELKVLGRAECTALGMGMFVAVAQGSPQEPRFIHVTYKPKKPNGKRVALIGKGVTFDSGGLSLKPSPGMEDMKTDMTGAATVLSTIAALADLESPFEVHAIAACTENMIGGGAYKLGDVLRSMNGKTVEINNTDAEGRLTLGDALTYALGLKPDEMFDFATLTGACVVALGPHIAGVMTNNQPLADAWLKAARSAGEDMWQLPLPERLKEQLKSEVADMKNTGERYGGAMTAGLFLKEFVGDVPWVHIDLAGPSATTKEWGHLSVGGTGFAVATIIEHLV
ncbi:MAG: leucyl aminopeptidase [Deltaproteobacteria bacterium]|nr:leucyl aminopeptidase [Deltaproteobacteria bacterium]